MPSPTDERCRNEVARGDVVADDYPVVTGCGELVGRRDVFHLDGSVCDGCIGAIIKGVPTLAVRRSSDDFSNGG